MFDRQNTSYSIDRCARAEACGGPRHQLRVFLLFGIFFVGPAVAQEPPTHAFGNADTPHAEESLFPDALVYPTPWHPDFMSVEPARPRPAVTMTSVAELRQESMPRRIVVLNNNVLRLGEHVILSNGQAWHWGPFPDAFLDARTLSFPMSR